MKSIEEVKIGDTCYLKSDLKNQCPMTVTKVERNLVHVAWRDKTNRHLYFGYEIEVLKFAE